MTAERILLIADARPRLVWRLALRIEQEAPGSRICGVLWHPGSPAPRRHRIRATAVALADLALRWMHACPEGSGGDGTFTDADLVQRSRAAGWPILMTREPHARAAYDFVHEHGADLAVVLADRTFPEEMLLIPRRGSIVARSRRATAPGSEGSSGPGPSSDDGPNETRIEVVRVEQAAPSSVVCSRTLVAEPYDTCTSSRLKADLVTNDLLVRSVACLARETALDDPTLTDEPGESLTPAPPSSLRERERTGRPQPASTIGRVPWKMALFAGLLSPYWIARNWYRRLRGRSPVIILFHHLVADSPHDLGMPTDAFFQAVRFIQKHYRVVGLSQALESLASGSVRVPTVALTFDDGYRENFRTLRAVMEETGVPLAFFVNTELIERERPFPHDARKGGSGFPPLTWEQVAYFARAGVEMGSHTRSHFDCGSGDRTTLEREIVGSRDDLESHLERSVRLFAFPWGQPQNMSPEAIEIARRAYPYVFAAYGGENRPDLYRSSGILLRRFQFPGLWELELGLQSLRDLALTLRRAVALRRRRPSGRPDQGPGVAGVRAEKAQA